MLTLMSVVPSEQCWRAWWDQLTSSERDWWHANAQRPFLTCEQVQLLRAEGLSLVAIGSQSPATEHVLFPLALAVLLEETYL